MIADPSLTLCLFCGASVKTMSHLFFTCDMITTVWYRIFRWLGWLIVIPRDPSRLFESFIFLGCSVKSIGGLYMSWHAIVWFILMVRNEVVFFGSIINGKYVKEKSIFWLENSFWEDHLRTLAPSQNGFITLSSGSTNKRLRFMGRLWVLVFLFFSCETLIW